MTKLSRALPLALVLVSALLLVLPFAWRGVPSGHDFDFHVSGWYDAAWQWTHGVRLPRMARWSDYGSSEPRFVFYPPLSWMWGALLTHLVSPRLITSAYIITVFSLGGWGAWLVARRWFGPAGAAWAAICFILNPYSVILVYWRSACAEMLGMALFPWILLALTTSWHRRSWHAAAFLALAFAAVWLANTPSAILVSYVLAVMVLAWASLHRQWRSAMMQACALALGLLLTSFYLLPAVYEQKWLDLTQVLEPSLSPRYNALFTHLGDVDFRHYNHLVSWIAVLLLLSLACAVALIFRHAGAQARFVLFSIALVGAVLLLPPATPIWEHLPKLRFVQFPWRYCFVLATALALATARLRPLHRILLLAVLWTATAFAMRTTAAPIYWTGSDDAQEFRDLIADGKGYPGVWDYAPANTSIDTIGEEDPEVAFRNGSGRVVRETVFEREFAVNARRPGPVRIEVLDYPAWHVYLDDAAVPNAHDDSGRMILRIPRGTHSIRAVWAEPRWPRVAGALITAAALVLCALLIAPRVHAIRRRQENSLHHVPQ